MQLCQQAHFPLKFCAIVSSNSLPAFEFFCIRDVHDFGPSSPRAWHETFRVAIIVASQEHPQCASCIQVAIVRCDLILYQVVYELHLRIFVHSIQGCPHTCRRRPLVSLRWRKGGEWAA